MTLWPRDTYFLMPGRAVNSLKNISGMKFATSRTFPLVSESHSGGQISKINTITPPITYISFIVAFLSEPVWGDQPPAVRKTLQIGQHRMCVRGTLIAYRSSADSH